MPKYEVPLLPQMTTYGKIVLLPSCSVTFYNYICLKMIVFLHVF